MAVLRISSKSDKINFNKKPIENIHYLPSKDHK